MELCHLPWNPHLHCLSHCPCLAVLYIHCFVKVDAIRCDEFCFDVDEFCCESHLQKCTLCIQCKYIALDRTWQEEST